MADKFKVPSKCKVCGSTSLTWDTQSKTNSGVPEGRLRSNEVHTVMFLGCDDCSETLVVIRAEKIAQLMNERALLAPVEPEPVMSQVKYYHVGDTGLVEGMALGRLTVVLLDDYNSLARQLNACEDREAACRYIAEVNAKAVGEHLARANALEDKLAKAMELLNSMTCGYREAISNGHDRITFNGGECDSPEKMLADNPAYGQARELLAAYKVKAR